MKKQPSFLLFLISIFCFASCGGNTPDKLKWWQKTIAYEIYPKSFKDSNNDGIGDLNGISANLDYLQSLNVGAIWLTPVYDSPMKDNGYDVKDYYKINPLFGNDEDMDRLIKQGKKHGIKVVMDLVFNHTSEEHQWFQDSIMKKNGKEDWYIWRDGVLGPDGNLLPPNNWGSVFGGSAWEYNQTRKQFYLHSFGKFQPDLNWENPQVRNALYDIANYWINKGVGGFRIDAVTYIKKPAGLPDGKVPEGETYCPVNNVSMNVPGILTFLDEFKKHVTDGKDIFTVAEANGVKSEELKYWVGKNGVFDMLFEFGICNLGCEGEKWYKPKDFDITDIKKFINASQQATVTNEGWYPMFFENHDQPRSVNHYLPNVPKEDQDAAAKGLGTILLTMHGTPFVYQGEEIGCINTNWNNINELDDISSKNQYEEALQHGLSEAQALECVRKFSRDNARTPMQWNDSTNAGFSEHTPWLRLNQEYETINVWNEKHNIDSVLNWYKEISDLRIEEPILTEGDFQMLLPNDKNIFAYTRGVGSKQVLVLVNFSKQNQDYDIDVSDMQPIANSLGNDYTPNKLKPYQSLILKK